MTELPSVLDVASASCLRDGSRRKQTSLRFNRRAAGMVFWVSIAFYVCALAESRKPAVITSLKVDVIQNKIGIGVEADRGLSIRTMLLAGPDRIVLDVPGAVFKVKKPAIQINAGPVKSVRIGLLQSEPPITRIVVDASTPLTYTSRTERNSAFLDITLPPAPQTAATAEKPPAPPAVTYERGLLTIVADNCSLADILNAVHSLTGGTTEFPAAAANERATVKLGPAPLAIVLTALLQGSPFDYVIAGSAQEPGGVQIILSEKSVHADIPAAPAVQSAPAQPEPALMTDAVGGTPVPAATGEVGQPGDGVQLMLNQPAAGVLPAADILPTPEFEELPDGPQPKKPRPSKENPRVPPPGKGKQPTP